MDLDTGCVRAVDERIGGLPDAVLHNAPELVAAAERGGVVGVDVAEREGEGTGEVDPHPLRLRDGERFLEGALGIRRTVDADEDGSVLFRAAGGAG
ncbi:hypothetical protein NLM24_38200 [Nocardia zapadnayensis]|nr:hypothetical protein [Nocardia zapadnayensis]MCX0276391.1 hypothetical protein [Nocardia zapadnayensis]